MPCSRQEQELIMLKAIGVLALIFFFV